MRRLELYLGNDSFVNLIRSTSNFDNGVNVTQVTYVNGESYTLLSQLGTRRLYQIDWGIDVTLSQGRYYYAVRSIPRSEFFQHCTIAEIAGSPQQDSNGFISEFDVDGTPDNLHLLVVDPTHAAADMNVQVFGQGRKRSKCFLVRYNVARNTCTQHRSDDSNTDDEPTTADYCHANYPSAYHGYCGVRWYSDYRFARY